MKNSISEYLYLYLILSSCFCKERKRNNAQRVSTEFLKTKDCLGSSESCNDPTKKCCDGLICNENYKCEPCLPDGSSCQNGEKCCHSCGWNSEKNRVCVLEQKCMNYMEGCSESSSGGPQCCKIDETTSQPLLCWKGQCRFEKQPGEFCRKFSECVTNKCYWDDSGNKNGLCQPEEFSKWCIDLNGDCNQSETIEKDNGEKMKKTCCKPNLCYNNKCVNCLQNDEKCENSGDCCSKICEKNIQGIMVCTSGNSDQKCIQQDGECSSEGNGAKCCEPFKCVNQKCIDCKGENLSCENNSDCCSNVCFWQKNGEKKICMKEIPLDQCIENNGKCNPSSNPPAKCCEGMCYEGVCKKCFKSDSESCFADSECCSGVCYYDVDGKKVCLKERKECYSENNFPCERDSDGGPKCCKDLKCIDGKCMGCLPSKLECKENKDCCEKHCDWSDEGTILICRKEDDLCGIKIGGNCSENPKSVPKKCCDSVCYESVCQKCGRFDGEECSLDEDCCSKLCTSDPNGDMKCLKSRTLLTKEGANCELQDGLPKCSEADGLICCDNVCSKLKRDGSECSDPEECCSKTCYWDNEGNKKPTCVAKSIDIKDLYLVEGGNCQQDPEIKIEKKCQEQLICYENKCMNCLQDNQKCSDNSQCCSKKCLFDQNGELLCLKEPTCLTKENLNCVISQNEADPHCCKELTCFDGKCLKCSQTALECKSDSECCSKHCNWDEKGEKTICMENADSCIKEEGSCQMEAEEKIPKKCCAGTTCYKSKKSSSNSCLSCSGDDQKCDKSSDCCSQLCIESVCQNAEKCAELGKACEIQDGIPKCCTGNCVDNVCSNCLPDHSNCKTGNDCCSGKCFWNDIRTELYCQAKETELCGKNKEKCDAGLQPPVNCCQGMSCKQGKCVQCLAEGKECLENTECCDGGCFVELDGKKLCGKHQKCQFQFKGACKLKDRLPRCCEETGLLCIANKCVSCLTDGSPCKADKFCCSKNCVWDTSGTTLRCRPFGEYCIEPNGLCNEDAVGYKEDDASEDFEDLREGLDENEETLSLKDPPPDSEEKEMEAEKPKIKEENENISDGSEDKMENGKILLEQKHLSFFPNQNPFNFSGFSHPFFSQMNPYMNFPQSPNYPYNLQNTQPPYFPNYQPYPFQTPNYYNANQNKINFLTENQKQATPGLNKHFVTDFNSSTFGANSFSLSDNYFSSLNGKKNESSLNSFQKGDKLKRLMAKHKGKTPKSDEEEDNPDSKDDNEYSPFRFLSTKENENGKEDRQNENTSKREYEDSEDHDDHNEDSQNENASSEEEKTSDNQNNSETLTNVKDEKSKESKKSKKLKKKKIKPESKKKFCCKGRCVSDRCEVCIVTDEKCIYNSDCCSGICDFQDKKKLEGQRICHSAPLYRSEGQSCNPEESHNCYRGLTCYNGYCKNCKNTDESCINDYECCSRICWPDSKKMGRFCKEEKECLGKNGPCSIYSDGLPICCEPPPNRAKIEYAYCSDNLCKTCLLNGAPCKNRVECCPGLVFSFNLKRLRAERRWT